MNDALIIGYASPGAEGLLMRIGLIAPPWVPVPPPAYGGTEAVVDRLARGLLGAGHDVLLAAPGDSTCPVPIVSPIERAATGEMGQSEVELAYVLGAYAAMTDVDLVHDHTLAGPVCGRLPSRIPLVATSHGPLDGRFAGIYRAAARRARIVAISAHQASTARGFAIARVIHHGLDVECVPVGAGDGDYVLFIGRMSADKGAREALLTAHDAGVRLLIAAKLQAPDEHAYFTEQVEPRLGPGAEFVGEIDAARRFELMGGARALLSPIQWNEPFGLVMIEALACGTPVVATPYGSVPELIDDGVTGFLRNTHDGLVAALTEVDSLDRAACRRSAEERFTSGRMVAEHIRLYEDLLREPSPVTNSSELRAPLPRQAAP